ncbi:MAG: bifunctional folylpolyglutamate synthase/dihydrofolate synthase [Croceitalea sp.]|nr:bifunctional folylpolyglutamate synthase/dihydrofolate synthase [Croceitalea sp.]
MTYQETLAWMFAQLPMYQNKGVSALKNKLDNIQAFAFHLNHPEEKFKSIHVAGTNGKGSSSHMLASILQEAGYKVGLYTSPHLKDFRERIKINGKCVSKKYVIDFISANKSFLEHHQLSFFELTVGMAFAYFASQKVDIAIIEVGLGGRLDSTNIIHPEVSLITNIGWDHTHVLGDTLEKIALEKAGIIKRDVPVVISERQAETQMIFKLLANQRNSQIVFSDEIEQEEFETDLNGSYQQRNIKGVLACVKQLHAFEIEEDDIKRGLLNVVCNTGLLGRWQTLRTAAPKVICDTGHNIDGIKMIVDQLEKQSYSTLHLVLGFANDKPVADLLALFPKEANYYFVKPNVPRGMDTAVISKTASLQKLKYTSCGSVKEGLEKALHRASDEDLIFVGGSTFVVAEVV